MRGSRGCFVFIAKLEACRRLRRQRHIGSPWLSNIYLGSWNTFPFFAFFLILVVVMEIGDPAGINIIGKQRGGDRIFLGRLVVRLGLLPHVLLGLIKLRLRYRRGSKHVPSSEPLLWESIRWTCFFLRRTPGSSWSLLWEGEWVALVSRANSCTACAFLLLRTSASRIEEGLKEVLNKGLVFDL